eukprot:scaffold101_cov123-Cylindrotheca_fusiformis.AAC.6
MVTTWGKKSERERKGRPSWPTINCVQRSSPKEAPVGWEEIVCCDWLIWSNSLRGSTLVRQQMTAR